MSFTLRRSRACSPASCTAAAWTASKARATSPISSWVSTPIGLTRTSGIRPSTAVIPAIVAGSRERAIWNAEPRSVRSGTSSDRATTTTTATVSSTSSATSTPSRTAPARRARRERGPVGRQLLLLRDLDVADQRGRSARGAVPLAGLGGGQRLAPRHRGEHPLLDALPGVHLGARDRGGPPLPQRRRRRRARGRRARRTGRPPAARSSGRRSARRPRWRAGGAPAPSPRPRSPRRSPPAAAGRARR